MIRRRQKPSWRVTPSLRTGRGGVETLHQETLHQQRLHLQTSDLQNIADALEAIAAGLRRAEADPGPAPQTTGTAPQLLLSVPDAAKALSVGRTKLRELIAAGELRAVRVDRRLLVPAVAVEQFVARLLAAGADGEPLPG